MGGKKGGRQTRRQGEQEKKRGDCGPIVYLASAAPKIARKYIRFPQAQILIATITQYFIGYLTKEKNLKKTHMCECVEISRAETERTGE